MVEFPKFKGFCEETKLHGIPRMTEGSKMSMAFWSVLVIISVSMAIKDLYMLVTTYQSEPTAITMFLAQLPTAFNWTTPTLCMEIDPPYIDYNTSVAQMMTNFNDPNSIEANIDELLMMFDIILNSDNYNVINVSRQSDNTNLFYYTYVMLTYLIQFEHQLIVSSNESDSHQYNNSGDDLIANRHSQFFWDQYNKRNVSMSDLTQAIGMWYCLLQLNGNTFRSAGKYPQIYSHFENYRYIGDPQYIDLPICKANMITYLGSGMVCSKLFETPYVPLKPKYNYFTIYDTRVTLSGNELMDVGTGYSFSGFAALVPNLKFHLDLQGRNVIPTDDHTNIFSWSPLDNVVLDISVSTEYQFLNTKKRSCSDSPVSQNDCVWRKRVDFVHRQCGCWPSLVDIQNPKNRVNCTSFNITDIYNINAKHFCPNVFPLQPDLSDCIMDCHLYNYTFTQQKSNIFISRTREWSAASNFNYLFGSFEFRFTSQPYNLITESFTTDWANFLGVWGGSIGTWLGASMLAFVHIPIYLFRQYCLPKSKVNRDGSD